MSGPVVRGSVPGERGHATRRVAVVGGGLAGLSSAIRLADAGREVVLLEASPRLGGLTSSFTRETSVGPLQVDTGQHVFLRCCHRYRAFLDRVGTSALVELQERLDVPVVDAATGSTSRIRRTGLPAPLHLARALATYAPLSLRERVMAGRTALSLRGVDPASAEVDETSFGAWLDEHGQSPRAVTALWDLIGVATLNAPAAQASLALAARVFRDGLLEDAASGDLGWSRVPLGRLHGEAAARALAAAGARVHTRAKVEGLAARADGWTVRCVGQEALDVDEVVLATPAPTAERLLPTGSVDLADGWSRRLGSSPIVNVHVVFDRTVLAEPFLAAVGSPVQFVFDRTEGSGLPRGQYVAVSLSAADALVDLRVEALRGLVVPALSALLPDAAAAEILEVFVTRERHATFRPAPGSGRFRPTVTTRSPGLVVAGAWTDTGWPATMEGAVRSGEAAADALLDPAATTRTSGAHPEVAA